MMPADDDDPPSRYYLLLDEAQCRALLRGEVPAEVKDMCRCMVDWIWDVAKNACKPVYPRRPARRRR